MPTQQWVIFPDFPLKSSGFFPGKHFNHFLLLKMKDFLDFVLHDGISNSGLGPLYCTGNKGVNRSIDIK